MDLSWDATSTEGPLSLAEVYMFEEVTAEYFLGVLKKDDGAALGGPDHIPLQVFVSAREQSVSDVDNRRTVDAVVTCIHASPEGGEPGSAATIPIDLDTALMKSVDPAELSLVNPRLSFRPYEETVVLEDFDTGNRTVADITLIVATAVLTVMLLTISSILLYITGGWAICWQRCTNCLFEEVDDDEMFDNGDEYMVDNKGTFQYETDNDQDADDDGSLETGLQTAPTGILGAEQDDHRVYTVNENDYDVDNPAAGLGIHTPAAPRDYEGASTIMDETPLSESNRPLGITGMPTPMLNRGNGGSDDAQKGGLAHMIMERMAQYAP